MASKGESSNPKVAERESLMKVSVDGMQRRRESHLKESLIPSKKQEAAPKSEKWLVGKRRLLHDNRSPQQCRIGVPGRCNLTAEI